MAKAGYKSGTGLGAKNQGKIEPIEASMQRGRLGFGHEGTKALDNNTEAGYDENFEIKSIEEFPLWLESSLDARKTISLMKYNEWIVFNKVFIFFLLRKYFFLF